MRLRSALGGVVLAGVAVAGAVVLVGPGEGGSTRVSDDTAILGRATTTPPRPTTTVAPPAATTTTVTAARASAEAVGTQSPAVQPQPGLVITNSGSAIADVGGNVVSGGSPGTVVTGGATAVGNSSSVRTP